MNLDNAKLWVQGLPERPLEPPAIKRLKDIVAPVQIIVGELDVLDIYSICDLLMSNTRDGKQIIIQNAGHLVSMEQPVLFDQTIDQFLRRIL